MLNHNDGGMSPISFCYWLRGFLEIAQPEKIKEWQIGIINEHLDLVLEPVTPTARYASTIKEALGDAGGVYGSGGVPEKLLHDKALEQVQRWYPDKVVPFKGERIYGSC